MKKTITLLILLFSVVLIKAQPERVAKFDSSFVNYFKKDRENIHLHLNKTTYLANEKIWFKGYVLDQKTKLLNGYTTNVFINLLDENGNIITSRLLFSANGTFQGSIYLNDLQLQTGTYYLHTYTNYMNNFIEDESSYFKINIINPTNPNELINCNLKSKISYDGSVFMMESENNVVVQITNCNDNGVKLNTVKVLDCNNKAIKTFSTNNLGFGKFSLPNPENCEYKIVVDENDLQLTSTLDFPKVSSIKVHANTYSIKEHLFLNILTNEYFLKLNKDKKFYIIIYQNDNIKYFDFSLTKPKKEILLPLSELPNGILTIVLVDEKYKEYSKKMVFNTFKNTNDINIWYEKKQDSLVIYGNTNNNVANISLTAVSGSNVSNFDTNNINNTLIFNAFSTEQIKTAYYYLEDFNRNKQFELDLFLTTSKPKYKLENILNNLPKDNYEFDAGLTIMGEVNQKEENTSNEIELYSIANSIKTRTPLNEKNEFIFENILIEDSVAIHFSQINKKGKLIDIHPYYFIKNNKRKFLKSFPFKNDIKTDTNKQVFKKNTYTNNDFPIITNSKILDTLKLELEKEVKLENIEKLYSNKFGQSYKIDKETAASFQYVLDYIRFIGYDVSYDSGSPVILNRNSRSLLGTRNVPVFLNSVPLMDLSPLYGLLTSQVSEIYVNRNGYGMGMGGTNGAISIYTKIDYTSERPLHSKSKMFNVKLGFSKLEQYKNPPYQNYYNKGFENFGTIHWEPEIITDENGSFKITIPYFYQKSIIINIQGINANSDFIYATKKINL